MKTPKKKQIPMEVVLEQSVVDSLNQLLEASREVGGPYTAATMVAERVALGIAPGEKLPDGERVCPGDENDSPDAHKFDKRYNDSAVNDPEYHKAVHEAVQPVVDEIVRGIQTEPATVEAVKQQLMELAQRLNIDVTFDWPAGSAKAHNSEAIKTLSVSPQNPVATAVPDLVTFGDVDTWLLLCKASSVKEGWMKTTKAMDLDGSVLVQTETQQRNPDGSYTLSQSVVHVPGVVIVNKYADDAATPVGRKLVRIDA